MKAKRKEKTQNSLYSRKLKKTKEATTFGFSGLAFYVKVIFKINPLK